MHTNPTPARTFKALLASGQALVVPGAHHPIAGRRVAEQTAK